MRTHTSLLIQALTVIVCCTGSRVQLPEDGGYRGIVFRIHPSVREENCAQIIQNIKSMISESSSALYTATRGRVWFGQVSIVLPPLWTDAYCQTEIKYPTENIPYKGEDIGLVGEDLIFGSQLITEQSQGCGFPGDRIRIPQSFLKNLNLTQGRWGNPGKLFLKEWSKYRYGVFDDSGFPGDVLYPAHVSYLDRIYPSGSSNAMLRGSWFYTNSSENCDPRYNECYFSPEPGRNDQVTCSISFLPFLPSVKDWCEPEQISTPIGPTKHNVLCNGKSVHQVINSHPDFKTSRTGKVELGETKYNIIRQPPPQYVVVLETSASMAGVWKWVRKALQNLIKFELPDNSRVAIVTFNKEARVEQNLSILTSEQVRIRVADAIPDSPNKLSRFEDRCVSCGVQIAMDQVLRTREAGGHIIIISQGDVRTLSSSDETIISGYENKHNVRISSVLIPISGVPVPFYQNIAEISDGRFQTISENKVGIYALSDLILSLRRIVSVDGQVPENVLVDKLSKPGGTVLTQGEFLLDSTLGRETRFGVFVEDDEDHKIKSIKLTDDTGRIYGPYTKMSSDYDIINFKTINFKVGDQHPFQEVGRRWFYEISWFPERKSVNNVIVVTSKQRNPDTSSHLETKIWISPTYPYNIFCRVRMGDQAVHDVRVDLNASYVRVDGGVDLLGNIQLLDDGVGDPDLQAGDGIYSRSISWSPGPGSILFSLTISDNKGQAYIVTPGPSIISQPENLQLPVCCGSRIDIPESRRKYLGLFQRNYSLSVGSIAGGEIDIIPPGKIGDLNGVLKDGFFYMNWTATGGDLQDGQTDVYRIYFSNNISELILGQGTDFVEFTQYDMVGSLANYSMSVQDRSGSLYVGMRAGDLSGNYGKLSNLLLVELGEEGGVTLPTPGESNGSSDWSLIGIILGVIIILVLCLIVLVVSVICGKRSRRLKTKTKSSGVNVHIPSPTRSDATDVSYDSDHQLVPTMSKPPSSTSFANNLTPTYWSASQLLSEHEQRTGSLARKPIKEQYINTNNNGVYNGYTITPLSNKTSIYGSPSEYGASEYSRGNTYGQHGTYGTYMEPTNDVDYGTVVVPQNLDEFSHLDYGVVTQSEGDYGSDLVDEVIDPVNRSTGFNVSDVSSSTLPMFNQSLRGSLISLSSAKKKNITQV